MSDLVQRLRGEYRTPIIDGLGPAGGDEPDNPHEFVRTFPVPPIHKEAASEIERLRETIEDTLAHLVAATSLLERGGKGAAPSDKMFDQMLADYRASIERARAALS